MYFSWIFISLLLGYGVLYLIWSPGIEIALGPIVLIIAWAIDLLITIKEPVISAKRVYPSPSYQQRKIAVEVVLVNPLRRRVRVCYKDEPPFAALPNNHKGWITVPAKGAVSIHYELTFSHRGKYQFGDLNLRYPGIFHLFTRRRHVKLSQDIEIYPKLTIINNYSFTAKTPSSNEGIHRTRLFSMGGELAQLREYFPGDDLRRINWKVSSHVGKLVVNEYEPEKDQNVFLLFDTGRMLFDQADQKRSRFDFILDSAILLAYNIIQQGDMVGALSFNQQVESYLPPGKGGHHLHSFVSRFFDLEAAMVESDYRAAFHFWLSRCNKRSLLFIYTDLIDSESSKELINHLKLIARHHLVVCILMKKQYLTDIIDSEINDETGAYLKGLALEFTAERQRLKSLLTASGIKVLEVSPQNIAVNVVKHYLGLKNIGSF